MTENEKKVLEISAMIDEEFWCYISEKNIDFDENDFDKIIFKLEKRIKKVLDNSEKI